MKELDIRFDEKSLSLMRSFIGKSMQCFICQRFIESTSVYGVVFYQIEGKTYRLSNLTESLNYMNIEDDVAVFRFSEVGSDEVKGLIGDLKLSTMPINQTIKEVRIMNENQKLFQNGILTNSVDTVRGLVFVFQDGRELSMEKEAWFSEEIDTKLGYNLMDEYTPLEKGFLDGWEDQPDCEPRASREIVVLSAE